MAQAVKVGIFAAICLVILAWMIWNIEDINPFAEADDVVPVLFDSVAGLDEKAAVRVAGVRVGRVDSIELQGRQALVRLVLEKNVPLTLGTQARIASLGLLGDKYVELVPGPADAPPLPEDTHIPGTTPPSFDDAMAQFSEIGESIQKLTGDLAEGDVGGNVNRLVADIEATSREIRALVAENRANVRSAVGNFDEVAAILARELPRLADQTNRALDQIAGLVEENRTDVSAGVDNFRDLTARLQTTADNLNQISGTIARGEGTLGKLVASDQAHDELVSTLDSIQTGVADLSQTLGALQRFRFDLDMQGWYLAEHEDSYTSLMLDIDPQDDRRLYRAGVSSTPAGDRREKTQVITVTNPDGTVETTTVETLTREKQYVLSAMFGYQAPRDLRLFAGIIEDSGGARVEAPLLDRKLWLAFEAFDFNRPGDLDPHFRLTGRWQFHPNLYLVGGYDDPLETDSFFLGGGIRWNDDNLKYLLGSIPTR
jgi:phospholipid/cholesterol/gamma-HCH transport system substrate-binding protein